MEKIGKITKFAIHTCPETAIVKVVLSKMILLVTVLG